MPASADAFARDGYVVLRSLIRDPKLSSLRRYVLRRADRGNMAAGDALLDDTPAAYGDFVLDGLLAEVLPRIERASGLELVPTYSYVRIYKHGDAVPAHRDRPACEISVSVALGYEAKRPWALWIEGPGGRLSFAAAPGDALLYRGIDCTHWREPFNGKRCAQLLLHYVDRNGPNTDWRFDKRPGLAPLPASARRDRGS